ncbi:GON domain-containing protein [Actinophytocola sp.]|uniref:GON domain-containing protein n=1 Tax=Actinophytocola sp. TaxID=1872138 RepID=UPI002ED14590
MFRRILVVAATALAATVLTTPPVVALPSPGSGVLPDSCAEIHAKRPSWGDGEYLLGVNFRLVPVYCHDMTGTPREYVSLGSLNFSQYTAGGASPGVSVVTTFTKVRIHPYSLTVDINDLTFATSEGRVIHGFVAVTTMPYAVAMSCDATPSGLGRVDLTGTPFVLADMFMLGGFFPQGEASVSTDNRTADLIGGGYCGWIAPAPFIYNPINPYLRDFRLELACAPFTTLDVLLHRACVNLT